MAERLHDSPGIGSATPAKAKEDNCNISLRFMSSDPGSHFEKHVTQQLIHFFARNYGGFMGALANYFTLSRVSEVAP
jgi:hypothetical protein